MRSCAGWRPRSSVALAPATSDIGMFPIPILTRDVPNYKIIPHTDTKWKGITVQFYLPPDDSTKHIGTIFHERRPDGSMPKVVKMPFLPNSGYAFAVGSDTWHSADPVGPEVRLATASCTPTSSISACCALSQPRPAGGQFRRERSAQLGSLSV